MITHRALAALFCTTGLVLLAAELLRDRRATLSPAFSAPYSAAMAVWCLLGWSLDSSALALVSLVQLASAALAGTRGSEA